MLSEDFKEFIGLLNSGQVEYLVVGGYAVAFHGHPRYTKDIDFWIMNSEENAKRVLDVLKNFGFASLGLTLKDFIQDDNVIQLGYPPNRIDIITGLNGIAFAEAYEERIVECFDGVNMNFIDLERLKASKRIAGRPKDFDDIEKLSS